MPPKPLPALVRRHYNISDRKRLRPPPPAPIPLLGVRWETFLALLFTLQTRPKLVAFPAVVQKRVIKTHWAACGTAATSARSAAELKEAPSNSEHLYKSGDSGLSRMVVFSALLCASTPPEKYNMTGCSTNKRDAIWIIVNRHPLVFPNSVLFYFYLVSACSCCCCAVDFPMWDNKGCESECEKCHG